jgi:hypothetical protein
VRECSRCGGEVMERYRFCPWCAASQRSKLVEFFVGTGGDASRALRVSRYLDRREVRFSVWDESGRAEAAVSLTEDEARRVAGFLSPRRTGLLDDLRALTRR